LNTRLSWSSMKYKNSQKLSETNSFNEIVSLTYTGSHLCEYFKIHDLINLAAVYLFIYCTNIFTG